MINIVFYSSEVARSMADSISNYTNSTYGIGITGKLNRVDKNNPSENDAITYICIYNKKIDKYYDFTCITNCISRIKNKDKIIELITIELGNIILKELK